LGKRKEGSLFALLYVSRSQLQPDREQEELDGIVRASIARNAAAEVTGALLFTGAHFAQWLEGTEAAVQAIMASIARDPRHSDVTVLQQGPAERRRFDAWSLAYSGRSTFAEVTASRALQNRDAYSVRNLTRLLLELAHPPAPPPSAG
jgi:hypothetical protein